MDLIGYDFSNPVVHGRQYLGEYTQRAQALAIPQLTTTQLYRTYVVYQDWRVLIIPSVLLLAETACGWSILAGILQLRTGAFTDPSMVKWEFSYITLALVVNVLCTGTATGVTRSLAVADNVIGLIAARILRQSRTLEGRIGCSSSKLFNNVARVLVETGLVYTAHTLLLTILSARRSLVLYPAADSVSLVTSPPIHMRADALPVHSDDSDLLPPHYYTYGARPAGCGCGRGIRAAVRAGSAELAFGAQRRLVRLRLGPAETGDRYGDGGEGSRPRLDLWAGFTDG
jgi:hypothetical protein